MTETDRRARNTARLAECYPTFLCQVGGIIHDLEQSGFRPRIQDAWRSPAEQLAAFQRGTSKLKYGFHNVTGADGGQESLAVDLLDDDRPLGPASAYLLALAGIAREHGCVTGIDWGLPTGLKVALWDAVNAGDWERPVKVGWDPTHIQPMGITVAAAQAGKRPS